MICIMPISLIGFSKKKRSGFSGLQFKFVKSSTRTVKYCKITHMLVRSSAGVSSPKKHDKRIFHNCKIVGLPPKTRVKGDLTGGTLLYFQLLNLVKILCLAWGGVELLTIRKKNVKSMASFFPLVFFGKGLGDFVRFQCRLSTFGRFEKCTWITLRICRACLAR